MTEALTPSQRRTYRDDRPCQQCGAPVHIVWRKDLALPEGGHLAIPIRQCRRAACPSNVDEGLNSEV